LSVIVIASTVGIAIFALRHYRVARQRRRVLVALARLEAGVANAPGPVALSRISEMLRRLALARFPRQQVAALTGDAWLRFLDESGGNGRFSQGPGRVLATGPYQRSLTANVDTAALTALVREWVGKNAEAGVATAARSHSRAPREP
jgi:Domain of unknown function (DUF4381)